MKKGILNCHLYHATENACDEMRAAVKHATAAMSEVEHVFENETNPVKGAVMACRKARNDLLKVLDSIIDREHAEKAQLEAFKKNMEAKRR